MKSQINPYSAVERAVFRSEGSLSAVLSSFCYSRVLLSESAEAKRTTNEHRAKSLKPTLPTALLKINP